MNVGLKMKLGLLLLSMSLLLLSSCKKEQCIVDSYDLVAVIDGSASILTVTAGAPIVIPFVIKAIENIHHEPCNDDAVVPETKALITVEQSFDQGNEWTEVESILVDVESFPVGEEVVLEYIFNFDDPGLYKFIICPDANNVLNERNEDNCSL